jgi:hypothetical protein
VGNVTSKTINISGYENGIYIFQVRARASGGTWGAYSGDRQFIADVPPDAPASSSPASGSTFTQGTSQTFSWSTPPAPNNNVERYYLRIVKGSDLNGTPVYHEELSGSTTSKSIAFVSGTYSTGNYVWGVRAIKSAPPGYNQTTYENAIGWGSYRTKNFAISDTQSGYGSISGTISTSISSGLVAVENVKVELRKNNSSVFQTYTSSDGSYSFGNVPSGVYEILISKNSYLTGKISYVNVSANKTVSNVDYSVFMPENVFSILQTDTDFIQSSYPNLFNKAKSLLDKFSTKLPSGLLEEEAEVLKRYDLALRFSKNAYTNGELFAYWSGETIGDLVTTALKMIIFDIAVQKWAEDKNFGRYLGERIIDPIKVKMANKLGEYSNKLVFTHYCGHTEKFVYYPKSMEVCDE